MLMKKKHEALGVIYNQSCIYVCAIIEIKSKYEILIS